MSHWDGRQSDKVLGGKAEPIIVSAMDGLSEVVPGKFFASIRRPAGTENFPFRVVFEVVDVVDARRSHYARSHHHDDYEVIVVDGGAYHFRINQRAGQVQRNGLLVLKPGDQHEDLCAGAVMFFAMRFRVLPGPTPNITRPRVTWSSWLMRSARISGWW